MPLQQETVVHAMTGRTTCCPATETPRVEGSTSAVTWPLPATVTFTPVTPAGMPKVCGCVAGRPVPHRGVAEPPLLPIVRMFVLPSPTAPRARPRLIELMSVLGLPPL